MTRIDRFENQRIKYYIFAAVFIFATVDAYAQGNGNMIIKVHEVLRVSALPRTRLQLHARHRASPVA